MFNANILDYMHKIGQSKKPDTPQRVMGDVVVCDSVSKQVDESRNAPLNKPFQKQDNREESKSLGRMNVDSFVHVNEFGEEANDENMMHVTNDESSSIRNLENKMSCKDLSIQIECSLMHSDAPQIDNYSCLKTDTQLKKLDPISSSVMNAFSKILASDSNCFDQSIIMPHIDLSDVINQEAYKFLFIDVNKKKLTPDTQYIFIPVLIGEKWSLLLYKLKQVQCYVYDSHRSDEFNKFEKDLNSLVHAIGTKFRRMGVTLNAIELNVKLIDIQNHKCKNDSGL